MKRNTTRENEQGDTEECGIAGACMQVPRRARRASLRRPTSGQLKEKNYEPHTIESVDTPHPVQCVSFGLFSVRTDTSCTAYSGKSHSNGHYCTNIRTTSYVHTAPNICAFSDIRANCRSYSKLDTCSAKPQVLKVGDKSQHTLRDVCECHTDD